MCLRCVVSSLSVVGYIKGGWRWWRWSRSKGVMNSFYLSRNSEGAMPDHQFVAVCEMVICLTLYFLGNTNELRNFALTTQQRKFFICSFEYGLLLVLQYLWCLGLLVLETKWLSGMLRWQRVVGRVRDVFKVSRWFCICFLEESLRYLHVVESGVTLGST